MHDSTEYTRAFFRAAKRAARRTAALLLTCALCLAAASPFGSLLPAHAASSNACGIIIGTPLHGNTSRVKNYRSIVVDVQYYYPNEI